MRNTEIRNNEEMNECSYCGEIKEGVSRFNYYGLCNDCHERAMTILPHIFQFAETNNKKLIDKEAGDVYGKIAKKNKKFNFVI